MLKNDTFTLGSFALSELLLMNDANYPWLILVPRVEDIIEIVDLSPKDQEQLLAEINMLSKLLRSEYSPDKLNIAALGNMVSQLHIHCVARFKHDAAWPKPIWGVHPAQAYSTQELEATARNLVAKVEAAGLLDFTSRRSYS